jgi:cis-3-alkyl-4-acyloxetan-2-one decarboxylase
MVSEATNTRIAHCRVRIEGPAAAGPADTLLFVHGWPDSLDLWDNMVAEFSPHRRCIRLTLPGFDAPTAPAPPALLHTLDDVNTALVSVVQQANGGQPVTLVLHDWGCILGYHFANTHPDLVRRVVGMDIGDAGSAEHVRSLSLFGKLGVVAYQRRLANLFRRAQRQPSDALDHAARQVATWIGVGGDRNRVRAAMGWPYEQTRIGGFKASKRLQFSAQRPLLFLYGKRKPFMFHSPVWATSVARTAGCQVHGLEAGHWVMHGPAQAECHRLVRAWLA